MLIPRYSLRWLLGLTTFSALISLILSYAVRGNAWAIGMASGLWTIVIVGLFYVAAFLAAWLIAQVFTATRGGAKARRIAVCSQAAAAGSRESTVDDRLNAGECRQSPATIEKEEAMLGTRSSFFAWRAVAVAAAVALLLMAHRSADAGGGTSIGLPLTTKNPSGLSLRIHSRGIDANGYRPVQIRVFPTTGKPFNFDRQLRIVLGFSKYGAQGVEKISQIVELPEARPALPRRCSFRRADRSKA